MVDISEEDVAANWPGVRARLHGAGDCRLLEFIEQARLAGDVVTLTTLKANILAYCDGEGAHGRLKDQRGTYHRAKQAIEQALEGMEGDND